MLKIGITGGIGSGKSTICKIFQTLGIPVYDADSQAKKLIRDDSNIKEKVIAVFGKEAYTSGGRVNRAFLGELVFSDTTALDRLNEIVHPAVKLDFEKWLDAQTTPYVLKEAAILIESGAYKEMDEIIVVEADIDTRTKRVMKRDHVEEAKVRERMDAQLTDEERRPYANHIINSNEDHLEIPQVIKIHEDIISRASR